MKNGIHKLLRYTMLDRALSKKNRQETTERLKCVWKNAQEKLQNSEVAAKESLKNELKKLGPSISSIYLPEIESADDLGHKILKFSQDTSRILAPPLQKADRGVRGPTYLVTFFSQKLRTCVIKYLNEDPREAIANRFYDGFGRCFSEKNTPLSLGFSVPCSARLDLKAHLHESAMGHIITPMHPSVSASIQQDLLQLAKTNTPELDPFPTITHVMLSEKIPGQNLFDFAHIKYQEFRKEDTTEENRKKFFERLGRLAMLDLFAGNLDRLVQINRNTDGQYHLDSSLEVNLGNVMVVYSKDKEGFRLYAIDNDIDKDLIEDQGARTEYVKFLKRLFASDDPFKDLANNIVITFNHSLSSQIDDIDAQYNLETVRKYLEPFKEDLKIIAPQAMELGLKNMFQGLKNKILPEIWRESPQAIDLQKYLKNVYPHFLEAVEERFNVLQLKESL